jgi:predicted O-linked N-acetylglucosamine transferase (SPINDLY family)
MAHNIPADRIIMEGSSARSQYFTDFNKIDIALDSFPFPGGTTTIDCLWMGVPVLNLTGNTFISRQGETILKNAGLSDWITTKEADYIALAKKKSSNKNNLVKIRKNLRNKLEKSPVMNTDRFGKNLGKALQDMWKIYLEGTN